jgi:hypothetical protein
MNRVAPRNHPIRHVPPPYPTHYLGGTGWTSTESLDQDWMYPQVTGSEEPQRPSGLGLLIRRFRVRILRGRTCGLYPLVQFASCLAQTDPGRDPFISKGLDPRQGFLEPFQELVVGRNALVEKLTMT